MNPFNNGFLEVQAISIVLRNNCRLAILNIYNPNSAVKAEELQHYTAQLGVRFIIVGDFNAHTPIINTNCVKSNFIGRSLETVLANDPICLVNPPDLYTYINPATGRGSCLDLCLTSPNLAALTQLEKGVDIGSDHITMVVNMSLTPIRMETAATPKFLQKTQEEIDQFCNNIQNSTLVMPVDINTLVEDFNSRIIESAEENISKSSGKVRQHRSTPWWNPECYKLVAARRSARRLLELHPMADNLKDYNSRTTASKEMCKKTKKESLQEYISSLKFDTPTGTVWKKLKSFQSSYIPTTFPIEDANGLITSNIDKAEVLAQHFASVSTTHVTTTPPDIDTTISAALADSSPQGYNSIIKMSELDDALSKPRKTSAGSDQIPYFLLRSLNNHNRKELLDIYNQCFCLGEMPQCWKVGTVIPISKPGKDPSNKESYRPITLLSCTSKILERIIQRRLEYVAYRGKYLKPEQSGFCRGLSTSDPLLQFEQELRQSLDSKQYSLVIYIDLTSAFDKVWGKGLIYKLSKLGLRGRLLRWLDNYLKNRKIEVRVNGKISQQIDLSAGTPQGAVCSPLLFNLMLSDLPTHRSVKQYIFADDITVVCSGKSLTELKNNVQHYLDDFSRWVEEWGMKINPNKTVMQVFSRRRFVQPIVRMAGQNIKYKKEQRLLGLIFDAPTLTWKAHTKYLKTEGLKRINIMKSVSSVNWGASGKVLRQFYSAYILAKIDYGSYLYASAADTHLKQIDIIQNAGLRLILGARRSTPILSLQAESRIPPLSLRRQYLACREFTRIMYRPVGDHTVTTLQMNNGMGNDSKIAARSFLDTVRSALHGFGIQVPRCPTRRISGVPPWMSASKFVKTGQDTPTRDPIMFDNYLKEEFEDYNIMYTDGSRITEPTPSVACAFYVPHLNRVQCWKLEHNHSIISAELFAILQGLQHIQQDHQRVNWVLFTDSMSSLTLIGGSAGSYIAIVNKIRNLLIELNKQKLVLLHWVKSHVGINGNEVADRAANFGHKNTVIFHLNLTKEESYSLLREKLGEQFDLQWKQDVVRSGKGLFLANIRENIHQRMPESYRNRRTEAVIHRLRMGHVGLSSYLHRFNMAESEECTDCGVPETVEHYLLHCSRYLRQRIMMSARLRFIDDDIIDLNLKLLLGGTEKYYNQRRQILQILASFIYETKRIDDL